MANIFEIIQRLVVVDNGCIEWTGACDSTGYGRVQYNGRVRGVHEVLYEFLHGSVPKGLELDHIVCNNTKCANDEHLKPVTHKENMLRGTNPCAMKARQIECVRGHLLSGDNLFVSLRGRRVCKICRREYQNKYRKLYGRPWG